MSGKRTAWGAAWGLTWTGTSCAESSLGSWFPGLRVFCLVDRKLQPVPVSSSNCAIAAVDDRCNRVPGTVSGLRSRFLLICLGIGFATEFRDTNDYIENPLQLKAVSFEFELLMCRLI